MSRIDRCFSTDWGSTRIGLKRGCLVIQRKVLAPGVKGFHGEVSVLEQISFAESSYEGPSELKLQISISTDKTVRELKQAIADKSDVEADRQRLIYSGLSRCSAFSWSNAYERNVADLVKKTSTEGTHVRACYRLHYLLPHIF